MLARWYQYICFFFIVHFFAGATYTPVHSYSHVTPAEDTSFSNELHFQL